MPWGVLLVLLAVAAPCAQAAAYCDAACQAAQQLTLSTLYNSTGGPSWAKTLVVVWDPAGWLNTTQADARPAHCLWTGEVASAGDDRVAQRSRAPPLYPPD